MFPFRPTGRYGRDVAEALRTETVGGIIMLVATVGALVWANVHLGSYTRLQHLRLGPMDLQHWADSGLLTVFFFIAGLELREELTHGELRNPKEAALPVIAAVAGVIVPALVFLLVSGGDTQGWAVPTATDVAFALAVLAVTFTGCPAPLRAFLLTLAVVDDLIAITIIAIVFTYGLKPWWLAAGIALIGLYGILQARGVRAPWALVPIAVAAWWLVHDSGIHATVAGVALGLLTNSAETPGDRRSNVEQADHVLRPLSAGVCVPVFAFLSAGVSLSPSSLGAVFTDRVALGVIAGLVIGKFVGVFGGAWTAVRLGLARFGDDLQWREIAAVAMLAGVGFTVSLLIGGLAYQEPAQFERVATAVLIASLLASASAAVAFRIRVRQQARDDAG